MTKTQLSDRLKDYTDAQIDVVIANTRRTLKPIPQTEEAIPEVQRTVFIEARYLVKTIMHYPAPPTRKTYLVNQEELFELMFNLNDCCCCEFIISVELKEQ